MLSLLIFNQQICLKTHFLLPRKIIFISLVKNDKLFKTNQI